MLTDLFCRVNYQNDLSLGANLLFRIRAVRSVSSFENDSFLLVTCISSLLYMGGSIGGTGGPNPPEKSPKNIGFLCNTGPDPLKITKLPN